MFNLKLAALRSLEKYYSEISTKEMTKCLCTNEFNFCRVSRQNYQKLFNKTYFLKIVMVGSKNRTLKAISQTDLTFFNNKILLGFEEYIKARGNNQISNFYTLT